MVRQEFSGRYGTRIVEGHWYVEKMWSSTVDTFIVETTGQDDRLVIGIRCFVWFQYQHSRCYALVIVAIDRHMDHFGLQVPWLTLVACP